MDHGGEMGGSLEVRRGVFQSAEYEIDLLQFADP
jgi:hypothetical protein